MVPKLYQTKENCCGCKVCANVCPKNAISFKADEYGFFYPVIDEQLCVECNSCVKACDFQKVGNYGHNPIEGIAARHKEKNVYDKSTSGGLFTAIAEYVLNKGGIVYGCAFDENMNPKHHSAENLEQIAPMRGSKYVQSDTNVIYREIKVRLKEGRTVLFTGTPCQVAGLYSFLGNNDIDKLLTVEIICHGVSSPGMFKDYINYLNSKHHYSICDFRFRDKRFGWERPVVSVDLKRGGSKWWFTTTDMFVENYFCSNLFRPSCFYCKYSCGTRYADFTIGDFWGYQKSNLKMSTKEGVSCCLLNNDKAMSIYEFLNVHYEKVGPAVIIAGNTNLRIPSKKGKQWDNVMNTIKENGYKKLSTQFRRTHRKAFLKAIVKRIILKPR